EAESLGHRVGVFHNQRRDLRNEIERAYHGEVTTKPADRFIANRRLVLGVRGAGQGVVQLTEDLGDAVAGHQVVRIVARERRWDLNSLAGCSLHGPRETDPIVRWHAPRLGQTRSSGQEHARMHAKRSSLVESLTHLEPAIDRRLESGI